MKALVLVDKVSDIPASAKSSLYVISLGNWQEAFSYLEGKKTSQYLFLHDTAPIERLLKLVEEYQGNLAVYTTQNVDPVFLSRFTKVVNRKAINVTDAEISKFMTGTDNEVLLKHLKGVLF